MILHYLRYFYFNSDKISEIWDEMRLEFGCSEDKFRCNEGKI